jgi:CheY-like chemotaxis protein
MTTSALIVDDSRIARRLVRLALPEDWDVEITEACDGQEAISVLETRPFDVVFLDLTMPEIDGYTVLKSLKDRRISPIVIVISGDLQPLAGARAMNLGAFEFIKKPIDRERLHEVLQLAGVV